MNTTSAKLPATLRWPSCWAAAAVLLGTLGCASGSLGNGDDLCGNLLLDDGEMCDDGNTTDGDGCSATCVVERCGDGVTQAGLGEECDDGNTIDGDGCSADCDNESTECGNGIIDIGEQCDDGNTDNWDGCSAICLVETAPNCGNGVLEAGEECDDGNTADGDGCSANCLVETSPVCGNGVVEGDEECDDGNTIDGDGCSANCLVEAPPVCGNGVLEAGEECDDGNTIDGDGCSATCQLGTLFLQPGPTDGKDAQVYDLNPDAPNGDATYSYAQAWTWSSVPGLRRSYFEFEFPAALAGCTVSSATLTLYHHPTSPHEGLGGNTLETEIARVTQAWDEHQLTWNNQPPVDTNSTVTIPPPSSSTADLQVDLTTMVNGWFANPGSNFGFRLKLQTEVHYRVVVLTSSDYLDNLLRRPSLTVDFSACP